MLLCRPRFVTQETIVQSMDLPAGLPVTPTDPEYDQVVNYWKAIAKNNTLDEVNFIAQTNLSH